MATKRVATTSSGKEVEITNYGGYDITKLSKNGLISGLTTSRNFANIAKPVSGEVSKADLICNIGGTDHRVSIFLGLKGSKDGQEAAGSAFLSKTAGAKFLSMLDTSSMDKFKASYSVNFIPFIQKYYAKADQGLLCKITCEEVSVDGDESTFRLRAVANESFPYEKWMEKYNVTEGDLNLLDDSIATLEGIDELNSLLMSDTDINGEFITAFQQSLVTREEVEELAAAKGVQVA
jgi:hypothetical protein